MAHSRGPGRPKNPPEIKAMLSDNIPISDIFDEMEKKIYDNLVAVYLKDFDEDQLTANDMDDIMSMAMNRVLEFRLLKASKGNTSMQLDVSAAVERLRKQTEKLKDNLAARRRDRVDPRKLSGLSIVDLAAAFDDNKKQDLLERATGMKQEELEILEANRETLIGNRSDEDAMIVEE
jgi:hypothetical protein